MDPDDSELLARLRELLSELYRGRLHPQQEELIRKAEADLSAGKVLDDGRRRTLDEIWLAVGPPSDPDDVEEPVEDKPGGRVLPLGHQDPANMFENEDPE